MLAHANASPLSWLVVPNHHRCAPILRDRAFLRAMDARLMQGDELVLHGLYHTDEAPAPRTLRGIVERRLLTRREGEFAALSESEAASRISCGVALFETLGWPLHGFVPPAWLMSDGAREALKKTAHPFSYVTVKSGMYRLPGWRFERTANLWYSPTSMPRRALSACAIRFELARARHAALLRISLHPQDVRFPGVLRHWERLIGDALASRRPVTKHAWASHATDPREPHGHPRSAESHDAALDDVERARAAC